MCKSPLNENALSSYGNHCSKVNSTILILRILLEYFNQLWFSERVTRNGKLVKNFSEKPCRMLVLGSLNYKYEVKLIRILITLWLSILDKDVRFQVLTAASMMFRIVFWNVLPCKIIVDRRFKSAYCLIHHPWWRQYAPLKRRSTNILHVSTFQKTILNWIKMFASMTNLFLRS
jgi:hypothetical protein